MRSCKFGRFAAVLAVVGVVAIMASPAQAAFKIRITDITNSVTATIEDQGPGDNGPGVGNLQIDNSGGGFAAFDPTSAATVSTTMLGTTGLLTDNFAAIRNTSAGNVMVRVEFTIGLDATSFGGATGFDFSGSGTPGVFRLNSVLTGNSVVNGIAGLPVMVQAFAGSGGTDFEMTVPMVAQTGLTIAGTNPVAFTAAGPPVFFFDLDGKASLTTAYEFTISPLASYNFGSQSTLIYTVVPEPTTFLSALPLLMIGGGLYLRRRKAA